MQDELSIEKARVAILVEERNELLRKVFELEEQVRRRTQRVLDVATACPKCGHQVSALICTKCGTPIPPRK